MLVVSHPIHDKRAMYRVEKVKSLGMAEPHLAPEANCGLSLCLPLFQLLLSRSSRSLDE